ncbi:hypothetical protein DAPPUDRAFT_251696 [Daphnia pulex]|uniref:Uncharacterized protein n=1 Tax=Daphnia pulex TaxID=6669 RepID=E9H0Y4_DAPPU|nr:hypothetical protein DAPPUDRAFT_251696 [Daphnia pulex]|eukprot:EFX74539.1 hypothetical protein DAPPUDRAFT_251696 [Daphnia pulex]
MIPPSKALEVFINRISSEIINVDAVLVTGYPRNMRDVVEYMARVQRISGVILLKDPNFQLFECGDDSTNDDVNKEELKMTSNAADEQLSHFRSSIFPVIQFFKQEELLHMVTLERSFLEIFHDIYDKVLLILSRLPQSPTHEIMTEETEVVDATTLVTSPARNNSSISREVSSKERSRIKSSNLHHKALNKDVRDVLSLVQAGSIMERVSSVNAKSRKK